jgi:glycerophosphoryl diester phosphodiesterase
VTPLAAAAAALILYAHNDYVHPRPVFDALDRGFCAVEADVHLRHGKLLVAHRWYEVDERRTLHGLYIVPLTRAKTACREVLLNLDVKTDALKTYEALKDVRLPGVRVLITGNRAKEEIERSGGQIDGDFSDVGKDPKVYPLVSLSWHWWSRKAAFKDAAAKAHAAGQKVRVFGTGDHFSLQRELGADYLNADDLDAARDFVGAR